MLVRGSLLKTYLALSPLRKASVRKLFKKYEAFDGHFGYDTARLKLLKESILETSYASFYTGVLNGMENEDDEY